MTDEKNIQVTKEQFAEALYYWLSENLKIEDIKVLVRELEFEIKSNTDFIRFFAEFTILNMWIVVDTCEALFKSENLKNECLYIFHQLVFKRNATQRDSVDFDTWLKTMSLKYIDLVQY